MAGLIEFLITAVNIFILFFIAGYFFSNMAVGMLSKRKARIVESIESARTEKEDAIQNRGMYDEKIKCFDAERADILERAGQRAKVRETEILQEAGLEAERIVSRAHKEADLKKAKVKDEIKRDMIVYASMTAGKLVAENIDAAGQEKLIEETLNEMGEATWQN